MPQKLPDKWDPDEYEEAQARRMLATRLRDEECAREWRSKWNEERARRIGQRRYFSWAEIAERLARDPYTLATDPELQERILADLAAWVQNRQFADGEVATLCGDPPDFRSFQLTPGATLVPDAEVLCLAGEACRRYTEARPELPGAAGLLRDWFASEASEPNAEGPGEQHQPLPPAKDGTEAPNAAPAELASIEQLAEWVFARHGTGSTFEKLYAKACGDIEIGGFKKSDFHAAFGSVYATSRHRPPATGWPLRSPYGERASK
jgi:hypothetical protein